MTINDIRDEYERRNTKLKEKKQKLIEEGTIDEWQLPIEVYKNCNYKELMENKEGLMRCMLPKETNEVHSYLGKYGYYLNRVIDETQRINLKDYKQLRKLLINYANDQSGIMMNVRLGYKR